MAAPDNGVRLWGFGLNDGPSNGADYLDKFEILETTPKGVELPLCAYNGAGNPIPVED